MLYTHRRCSSRESVVGIPQFGPTVSLNAAGLLALRRQPVSLPFTPGARGRGVLHHMQMDRITLVVVFIRAAVIALHFRAGR